MTACLGVLKAAQSTRQARLSTTDFEDWQPWEAVPQESVLRHSEGKSEHISTTRVKVVFAVGQNVPIQQFEPAAQSLGILRRRRYVDWNQLGNR